MHNLFLFLFIDSHKSDHKISFSFIKGYISLDDTRLSSNYLDFFCQVKILIDKNANVNLTDANGTTALIYATQFKNVEAIKLLLEHRADKTKVDKKGKTAFEYAVFADNEEIVNVLK